jgi:hypothetical protein
VKLRRRALGEEAVVLKLSSAEALVLFDWLSRADPAGGLPPPDAAEQNVLWEIEAQLEKGLAEPFSPEYEQLLREARALVRGDPTSLLHDVPWP